MSDIGRYAPIAARLIAADPGQQQRLWKGPRRRYAGRAVAITEHSLDTPAAAVLFGPARGRRQGLARTLVLDFDCKPTQSATAIHVQQLRDAAELDALRASILLEDCGAFPVEDLAATTGGRHLYATVAESDEFSVDEIRPIMHALRGMFPTLDIGPMTNRKVGCISYPGSHVKEGGRRELVGSSDPIEMVDRLRHRALPGFLDRLRERLQPQLQLLLTEDTDEKDEFEDPRARSDVAADLANSGRSLTAVLPAEHVIRSPLPTWVKRFIKTGTWPSERRRRDGELWTASEARLSTLHHLAARGWSGNQTWDAIQQWPPVWSAYAARTPKQRIALFADEWEKAYGKAKNAAQPRHDRKVQKSASPEHKVEQTAHRGGSSPAALLAAARTWILRSGHFPNRSLGSALLVVTALAHGCSLTASPSCAFGGRGLSLASGLPAETVWRTLNTLRSLPGSPVQLLRSSNPINGTGDEYALVTPLLDGRPVHASWWEVDAARLDAVDPVWAVLGWSAWWIYETMRALDRGDRSEPIPTRTIATAGRVSADTVERALVVLTDRGLVDRTHGTAVRTGRSVRQLGMLTAVADELHTSRKERYARERREFKQFLGIIAIEYGPEAAAILAHIGRYGLDNAAHIIDAADDRAYWSSIMHSPPPPDENASADAAADEALALVERELGGRPVAANNFRAPGC